MHFISNFLILCSFMMLSWPWRSVEQALPDSLFASPTKATGDYHADFSTLAEVNESAVFSASSSSEDKLEPTTSSSDVASH